ncbi:hypothetical protein HY085_01765 [Candidatus Gottesmanbacteria bacterium]|nr:hypothetical protein [Candidatus Gottesmanbacteria bacterium]
MDGLVRTQVMLFPNQKQAVDQMGIFWNVSMSEVIRRAVDNYTQKFQQKQAAKRALAERLAGSWANSPNWKGVNGSKYQREIRREQGI